MRSTLFAQPSFILHDVVIGIDFHWEQKRTLQFAGGLKFIVEGDRIRAVNGGSLDRTAILEDYESNRTYQIHTEDHQLISLSTALTDGTIRPQIMLFSGETARKTEGGTK